jgi:hypothetical protein
MGGVICTAARSDVKNGTELNPLDSNIPNPLDPVIPFTQEDDIDQVLGVFFKGIDRNNKNLVSIDDILSGLNGSPGFSNLKSHLDEGLRCAGSKDGIDSETFKTVARKTGIAIGERTIWTKCLNLDEIFARLLKVGAPMDELSSIRTMGDAEIEALLNAFLVAVANVLKAELKRLGERGQTAGSGRVEEALNKFTGVVGRFGDAAMFQEGLESQLGSPDPFILKGILREHMSTERSVTSNYKINFSNEQEYARVFGHPSEYERTHDTILLESECSEDIPIFLQEIAKGLHRSVKGPSEAELRDLTTSFQKHRRCYVDICKMNNGKFPGEFGHVHKSMEIEVVTQDSKASGNFFKKLVDFGKSGFEKFGLAFSLVGVLDPLPSQPQFKFIIYAPLRFFSEKRDQELLASFVTIEPSVRILKRSCRVYVYCEVERADKDAMLREILGSSEVDGCFDIDDLEQILCPRVNLSGQSEADLAKLYIDKIVSAATNPNDSDIVLIPGRRRLGLREMMQIPEVKSAELRVEEAIQAYQYTGPLFQVRVSD